MGRGLCTHILHWILLFDSVQLVFTAFDLAMYALELFPLVFTQFRPIDIGMHITSRPLRTVWVAFGWSWSCMHYEHVCQRVLHISKFQLSCTMLICHHFKKFPTPRGATPHILWISACHLDQRFDISVGHMHAWWQAISRKSTPASSQLPKLVSRGTHEWFCCWKSLPNFHHPFSMCSKPRIRDFSAYYWDMGSVCMVCVQCLL